MKPGSGDFVGVVMVQALDRPSVARSHGLQGSDEPGPFSQNRRSEVPVIEDLHLDGLILQVHELVAHDQVV